MYGHLQCHVRLHLATALLCITLVAATSAGAASSDRIFANGFDPCCRVGGTVAGLSGSGLVLHLAAGAISEDHAIHQNGIYDFAASVPSGSAWAVSVKTQASGQFCQLVNASGTMGSANVDNVDVSCGSNALIWDEGQWDDGQWQ